MHSAARDLTWGSSRASPSLGSGLTEQPPPGGVEERPCWPLGVTGEGVDLRRGRSEAGPGRLQGGGGRPGSGSEVVPGPLDPGS